MVATAPQSDRLESAIRLLARLYPKPSDAAEVVRNAGLPPELLQGARWHRDAKSFWRSVVTAADQLGRLSALLHAARNRYGRGAARLLRADTMPERAALLVPLAFGGIGTGATIVVATLVFGTQSLPESVVAQLVTAPVTDTSALAPSALDRSALDRSALDESGLDPSVADWVVGVADAPPEAAVVRAATASRGAGGAQRLPRRVAEAATDQPPWVSDAVTGVPLPAGPGIVATPVAAPPRAATQAVGGNARESNPPSTPLDALHRF